VKILAIETSCDETGIALLETTQKSGGLHATVIANELTSQASDHEKYGGVFPTLAKRLHGQNFPPLFSRICEQSKTSTHTVTASDKKQIKHWLKRHDGLPEALFKQCEDSVPAVDLITVTTGPGLSPALWVGTNIARSLALITNTPVLPVNHMAGHLISALAPDNYDDEFIVANPQHPAIALLVSGGHTELIKETADGTQTKIGQTRDDAAGEAFDKVGRLLGLEYPAGPQVSQLAHQARENQPNQNKKESGISLPRPMIDSDGLDFSFAGLKSAAVRLLDKFKPLSDEQRCVFARELEDAIVDVLIAKTAQAINEYDAHSLLAGGGVIANEQLRQRLKIAANKHDCQLHLSPLSLATDNAVMIGLTGAKDLYENDPTTYQKDALKKLTIDSRLSL
jgi:N6-L-threonylcarbamoyladenine synthase